MNDAEEVIKIANDWLEHGERVCLATIVKRDGSAPRGVGAKMAISSSGGMAGTIGGGAAEKQVIDRAHEVMADGKPVIVDFDLSGRSEDLDSVCGGSMSVFLEPLGQSRLLFVMGAGHVGKAVAKLAREVGFSPVLVDNREDALKEENRPAGVRCAVATPDDFKPMLEINETSFVVVCTSGHSLDKEWLRVLAPMRPRYIGMLGSRHKAKTILEKLESDGVSADDLARVHVPVGLDIKAVTPEEIAVSIVGQLVLEWRSAGQTQEQ
ncbi:MAG: XdhC/CoxI family protein [Candidatus Eisenbacteria bacterium]